MSAAALWRKVKFGPQATTVERRADGCLVLRSPQALGQFDTRLTDWLHKWAAERPEHVFLAKRNASGAWQKLGYREVLARVRTLAQALLDRGLSAERPLVILSGNDLEHALLGLAAAYAGIPFAPISVPYSLVSKDFDKLRYIIDLLRPGLVFTADGEMFARAIAATVPPATPLVVTARAPAGRPALLFADLEKTPVTPAVDAAHAQVGADTIVKFLFTSGSTGMPKGVINTQRMITSNQRMIAYALPFLDTRSGAAPPTLLDWPPWNHTFGGNHDFYCMLYHGGTLYIDDGKPVPGLIAQTAANLKEVAPTFYLNVPKGYEMLLPFLREDRQLRKHFFGKVQCLFYAGAALAPHVAAELEQLAIKTCGERLPMITSLGATETAPAVTFLNWVTQRPANVGLPLPGQELKLVPSGTGPGAKLEMRVRGPNITPGYWRKPELTAAAFDEEGYYKIGDALKFADPDDPQQGLVFDGRVAEDFKLATGTWVSVGPLRASVVTAGAPVVQDAVIAGHDRDEVAALIFPVADACRALAGAAATTPLAEVIAHANVQSAIQAALDALAAQATGSATRIARAMLMGEPPSLDVGEATDKGSLNQRAVLAHRAALVEQLYAEPPGAGVLVARRPR